MPYFKFYVGDWLSDTIDLTLEQRGAYIQLLAWSWKRGMPLPLDEVHRARILGLDPERFRDVWDGLRGHWRETDKGWVNQRLEKERKDAVKMHRKRVAAGRKGGQAKPKQSSSNARAGLELIPGNAQASQKSEVIGQKSELDHGGEVLQA